MTQESQFLQFVLKEWLQNVFEKNCSIMYILEKKRSWEVLGSPGKEVLGPGTKKARDLKKGKVLGKWKLQL